MRDIRQRVTNFNLLRMGLLQLSRPVEFEGVSPVTAVFYDDQCGHVISVRGGGVTGVVVRGINTASNNNNVLTHRLSDSPGSGAIISIKLSPSHATLSVQRSVNSVTFIPLTGASAASGDPSLEYSQAARAKACSVLGFVWLTNSDLGYVTDGGIELYSVNQVKIKWLLVFCFLSLCPSVCPFGPKLSNLHLSGSGFSQVGLRSL